MPGLGATFPRAGSSELGGLSACFLRAFPVQNAKQRGAPHRSPRGPHAGSLPGSSGIKLGSKGCKGNCWDSERPGRPCVAGPPSYWEGGGLRTSTGDKASCLVSHLSLSLCVQGLLPCGESPRGGMMLSSTGNLVKLGCSRVGCSHLGCDGVDRPGFQLPSLPVIFWEFLQLLGLSFPLCPKGRVGGGNKMTSETLSGSNNP